MRHIEKLSLDRVKSGISDFVIFIYYSGEFCNTEQLVVTVYSGLFIRHSRSWIFIWQLKKPKPVPELYSALAITTWQLLFLIV